MIFVAIWLAMGFWATFMWYKSFGGFNVKFGLTPFVVFMAFFAAPMCSIAWTLGYILDKKEK